ncbi:MAG TPA: TIGR03619 family F420-dependent LLM class oxidoreductase [Chloroflexota bacterium]|nr:TIGR03619 family F420-dependent LLM class oxidoreductase [Chloroflexota bacterium]
MDIGIALPQWGRHASPEAISRVAREAERLGYASVWVQERLLRPTHPRSGYGGVPGAPWPEPYRIVYDPIETLSYVASQTTRLKLGTSVLDALFHVPVVLARRLATLDRFSGGRVVVGLGQGWSEDEFITANVPPKRRGAGFEEFIRAMRAVWGPDPVSFAGRHYQIPESEIGPKPVQPGGPPILVGAFAPAAIERAARIADGLNPIAIGWDMLQDMVTRFRDAARAAGRDPSTLQFVVRANNQLSDAPLGNDRGPFSGNAQQIRDDLTRAEGMGLTHVFFDFGFVETPIDPQLRMLEQLAQR